ncbi:MAG: glutamyl-tRNA reductase [Pirellulales bacterium]|jgi:glutamyl-tRNA reductase|nr:glutamyl-tRNA reductase [Pirellulales bacterium]
MKVQVVGMSHRRTPVALRERLAFDEQQAGEALEVLRRRFPESEAVLLSTCNRVELYTASENPQGAPSKAEAALFLAEQRGLRAEEILEHLVDCSGEEAIRHLFCVAASLDSMVLGEPQIVSQVKQAYELACARQATGPLTNQIFQAALRVAKRIATETSINERRVSIPSVAVCDFARQVFERFEDKRVLVIGAGEMGQETLRFLVQEGVQQITVLNRDVEKARALAEAWKGRAAAWQDLEAELALADVVISTTGATQPIVTLEQFRRVEARREQRDLFVLDLAIPRDFDPAIAEHGLNVYLYTIDDLQAVCEQNRRKRDRDLPAALQIVEQEAARFMVELNHWATGPIIKRLRLGWQGISDEELRRLFCRLPELSDQQREEIRQSFERLLNKLLHPPLQSLRSEARHGVPHGLLEALKRLFHLSE